MCLTTVPVDAIRVEKWRSEEPLLVVSLLVSHFIWLLDLVTIIVAVCAAMFGVFFFRMHLGFTAHVPGSADDVVIDSRRGASGGR